jgi:hypothetical protein
MNVKCGTISQRWLVTRVCLFLVFTGGLVGCGPNLAEVSGTVTFKGEKVKGGMLFFSPATEGKANPGAPAAATVQEDGTFALKTGTSEGAMVGKTAVRYSAPAGEASTDPNKQGTASPYSGLAPKEATFEVKPGKNNFNIELVPGK